MRRPPTLVAAALIVIAVAAGGCGTSCPSALLTGVLARDADELVVVDGGGGSGIVERIRWPAGYRLVTRDGSLVAVDFFGTEKAREGETVRLGGGEQEAGVWGVCGLVEVAGR